jgi:hypothetical protein
MSDGWCAGRGNTEVADLRQLAKEDPQQRVSYTVKRLCWFGMRLWKAMHERKEIAKEHAERKGGGRRA